MNEPITRLFLCRLALFIVWKICHVLGNAQQITYMRSNQVAWESELDEIASEK